MNPPPAGEGIALFAFPITARTNPDCSMTFRAPVVPTGTDVTESFWVKSYRVPRILQFLFGELRRRRNIGDMTTTLTRTRAVVEGD
jgi:hypothetical protein